MQACIFLRVVEKSAQAVYDFAGSAFLSVYHHVQRSSRLSLTKLTLVKELLDILRVYPYYFLPCASMGS